jgi:hypothetical protein
MLGQHLTALPIRGEDGNSRVAVPEALVQECRQWTQKRNALMHGKRMSKRGYVARSIHDLETFLREVAGFLTELDAV